MKKVSRLFILLACLALHQNATGQSWHDFTSGIADKEFYSVAEDRDGNTVYVGTSGGLYARGPSDKEWKRVFSCRGQYKGVIYAGINADNVIYIATKNGFYASRDSGKAWKRLFRGIGGENYCTYVTCPPKSANTIYLGTLKGLFWTKDAGKTWIRPAGMLGSARISSIAVGEKAEEGHIFIICDNEVYKSGKRFEDYSKVFGSDSLKSFESSDEAEEDTESSEEGEVVFLLNHIASKKGILYLATNRGLFASEDNGGSWFQLSNIGLLNRWINYVAVSGDGERIYAATKSGVFEYIRKDETWNKIYGGMDSTDVKQIMLGKRNKLLALCKRRVYETENRNSFASGEKPLSADSVLSNFENEPTINETMAMAIDYAEVYPEKIKKWRRDAKFKALLPKLSLGIDRSASDTYEIYTSSQSAYWMYGPRDNTEGWDLNFSWDLADLIWNDAQTNIDVRSKLMVQLRDDIVDEVNRAYFERRRLQVELLTDPPSAVPEILKKRLRIQELTATLDGLTGSRFSKALDNNSK